MTRLFFVLGCCLVFAGCATGNAMFSEEEMGSILSRDYQQQTIDRARKSRPAALTREEWLQVTSREYLGVTIDQAVSAAEEVLRLADGDDFKIFHADDGFHATRNWTIYLVLAAATGTDYWRVTAQEIDGGVKLSVQVNTQSQAISAMPTTSGAWAAFTGPLAGRPVEGTAIYDLFWGRMDYLMGLRPDWMTCEMARDRVKQGIVWGRRDALCDPFNTRDQVPESARSSLPARPEMPIQSSGPRSIFFSE